MSKRRRERDPEAGRGASQPPEARASGKAARDGSLLRDFVILTAAFGIGVGLAELFGAANLGVAFGVGQIVFAVVLVVLLTRD